MFCCIDISFSLPLTQGNLWDADVVAVVDVGVAGVVSLVKCWSDICSVLVNRSYVCGNIYLWEV